LRRADLGARPAAGGRGAGGRRRPGRRRADDGDRDPRDRLRAAGGESGRGAGGGKDRRERDGGGGAGAAEGGGDADAARALRVRLACVKEAPLRHAPIAQLDRASDYESEGRVFESPWAHWYLAEGYAKRVSERAADRKST